MKRNIWLRIETIALLATALVIGYLLLVRPIVGVADNGDFERIMQTVGLGYYPIDAEWKDRFFTYIRSQYTYEAFHFSGYVSTQLPVVFAAVLAVRPFSGSFDIRVLGVLYGILFLTALWLLIRYNRTNSRLVNIALAGAAVFILADIGNIAYFNSLFGEPVSFVFILLTVGLSAALVRSDRARIVLLVLFFACAFMTMGSKTQNAPIGVIFALLGLRFLKLRSDRAWRQTVWIGASLLVVLSGVLYAAAPNGLRQINQYQTVFTGVLKDSPNPERDLRDLGLPTELQALAGTNYFQDTSPYKKDSPEFKAMFYDHISHGKVAMFYLTHPGRFVQKLDAATESASIVRPYYLGNYEKKEMMDHSVSSAFDSWSTFKKDVLPHRLWLVALFYAIFYAVWVFHYRRARTPAGRAYLDTFAAIGLIGLFSLAIPLIGDGEADLTKHLYVFNVCYDLMIVAAVGWVAWRVRGFFWNRVPQNKATEPPEAEPAA